jgi:hypothetical protein
MVFRGKVRGGVADAPFGRVRLLPVIADGDSRSSPAGAEMRGQIRHLESQWAPLAPPIPIRASSWWPRSDRTKWTSHWCLFHWLFNPSQSARLCFTPATSARSKMRRKMREARHSADHTLVLLQACDRLGLLPN